MKPRQLIKDTAFRVFVRLPCEKDLEPFLAAVRQSRFLHTPWVKPPGTVDGFHIFLDTSDTPGCRRFLVLHRGDGGLVGAYNLTHIIRGSFQSAFLGYYGFVLHTGKGLMKEGLLLVLQHAFERMKLHRVEANIQPANEASRALVSGCGFTCEGLSPRYLRIGGRWRDHERWAILREDFG